MTEPFTALRAYWSERGLTPGPGVAATDLATFEARHQVRLPADVRHYFSTVNGVVGGRDGAWDADLIAFWPLTDVQPLASLTPNTTIPQASSYLVFADWSIDAWFYAVRLPANATDAAPVTIVGDDSVRQVAGSLGEFFVRYLQGDDVVRYGVSTVPGQPGG